MNKAESKYFNTAKKMNEALIKILDEKPFEYITISEICEKAGVNRSTFYLHYENTIDLLSETSDHLIDSFLSYFTVETSNISTNYKNCELSELNYISGKYLHPYLTYMKENKHFFLTAMNHTQSFRFEETYKKMYEYIFNPILDRFHYPIDDRKYVMAFYLNGINAIVVEWLKEGCKKSIEEMEQVIYECIFGLDSNFISHLSNHIDKKNQDHLPEW